MDLNDLTPKHDTITVTLRHPQTDEVLLNDDETPMTITVMAPHTKEYKGLVYKNSQDKLKDATKKDLEFNELFDFSIDILASVTTDWNITFEGKMPKYSLKLAKQLYDVFWIKEQIEFELQTFDVFTKD